ncbi:MAG: ROK family protein [Chloroflexota bacterium]|nr:ROK family protein [Chloroflexota bacterium]
MTDEPAIAVDLGGTNIRVAVVTSAGQLSHRHAIATEAVDGPDAVIARMAALIDTVATDAGLGANVPVGVASPGPLDTRTGVVLFTPNLPGWLNVPLVAKLASATRRRVAFANDGNCGALGEVRFGAAKGVDHLVYIALGTGIGGGVVTDGHLIDGFRGLGGEVGHVVVAMDGPRCTCGAIGCLEAFASGWAIQREANLIARTAEGAEIVRLAAGGPMHAGVVAAAAQGGDPAALQILGRAGRALGAAMGAFANIFNPQAIVIGGGVAHLGELLLEPARVAMAGYSFVDARHDLTISYSSLGDDTALFGAGALALTRFSGR